MGLEREHDARTLKVGRELETRPSVADERQLTTQARAREEEMRRARMAEMLGHLRAAERELEAARRCLPAVDRPTRRNLDRVRQAIARIRED